MSSSAQALDPDLSARSREQAEKIASGRDELTLARVRAAGAGDRRAQRWLAEAVLADVRTVARSLSRCSVEADDAAQFAIIQVLAAAARFEGRSSVRHWARRVATLAVLKHQRRVRSRQAREQALEPTLLEPPRGASAPSLGEALPRSLREYLAELPQEQAEVLILKHALGHSVPEIAELTDSSPNTVKSRLRLGTKELRRRVRQDTFTGGSR
ncbi:sigma-70 family RNA polymerase sigma factor [Pseudenhygromyxa sp. WMMC2535]|uniref:RNA polymerase sigma factor n=1 Tax=Pseudenhygromyxa sp. WMMC2535 TaxID=2712867 RepID=UPI0015555A1B|nr:sigma-70 family RNA polymerase sigma factor [Pseudenhygromyxa sp. WMMC2535]NVB40645.1 sigma-70 family RNA polymerase sigma factor [Pseudenhygromyxa sp. WMMC2535]